MTSQMPASLRQALMPFQVRPTGCVCAADLYTNYDLHDLGRKLCILTACLMYPGSMLRTSVCVSSITPLILHGSCLMQVEGVRFGLQRQGRCLIADEVSSPALLFPRLYYQLFSV